MLPRLLARLLRTALVFLLVLAFLLLQLHSPAPSAAPAGAEPSEGSSPSEPSSSPVSTAPPPPTTPLSPWLAGTVERLNDEQVVRAPGGGEPAPLQPSDVVIVIQVHTRLDYLRQLIGSLRAARGIETVLLVFSHDVFDEAVNAEVRRVDFCRFIQVFYPFSLQLHPHTFPGQSAQDCARDMTRDRAVKAGCVNALYPDKYGHYREARFTQTKHHWWWKANRVFDQLEFTKNHSGLFLFLEEDHYVAPDFLHVLQLMSEARPQHCLHCNILSLGTYLKVYNYRADTARVELTQWYGSKHNMGMAFNRTTWRMLRSCTSLFCSFDDYNWDWSVQYISQTGCTGQKLHAMLIKAPRVFHIGECGVHHRGKNCDKFSLLKRVSATLLSASRYLFPPRITAYLAITRRLKLIKGNGGWGDPRDHYMCTTLRLPNSTWTWPQPRPEPAKAAAPAAARRAWRRRGVPGS
ncbi:alpha-1,6-mannosyl-glycoprotein 2-beta-N-acetylglucosaminyltransferase-like [Amphibalanus amphitrite]|uniref:alpha-1,6-mannosyl-glycoprotein 2-beta-N-acetylglucosaminyltransferase-like n=1 Tax=Amphibalanus amphitrite TaxID=1232801 RepID=UPI001C91AE38|nr:alpha-1,6-mannosyl-glycoprotein 2-beta-N-acetylglucosaminyltransferase-like [Amphibalanus amphitrite]XP_043232123.1 alpha-1,6-mannosyl-glycoprotein 2-beta-N-acetylglucosaminyltransferase-like [Amphibalanus amphitrite]